MKKKIIICLMAVMCMAFTGCGDEMPLTNEQNDLIAEYIAGTLLKYSYEYEWKYTKLNTVLNTYVEKDQNGNPIERPTVSANTGNNIQPTTKVQNNSSGGSNPGTIANSNPLISLPELLGIQGVSVSYKANVVGNTYPLGDAILSVPAENGCKVVAVEFTLRNTTSADIVANTSKSGVSMKLSINGTTVNSYTSMLKGDLLNLKSVTIPSGKDYTAFVLFQVNSSSAEPVTGSVLTISSGGSTLGTVTLN